MAGKIYLIPQFISEHADAQDIQKSVAEIVRGLQWFAVEDRVSAQRFIKKLHPSFPFEHCAFFLLNEHTVLKDVEHFLASTREHDLGVISESGCPCIADPGAELVLLAHQTNRGVIPLGGLSSIFLALMGSGLNGQNFAFAGYLPKDKELRRARIKKLEHRSVEEGQTQIFMETPYRNENLFQEICAVCHPQTHLCLAVDLTGPAQYIRTLSVREWRGQKPPIQKRPTLFLIQNTSQGTRRTAHVSCQRRRHL